jgi:hypothetical protein
MHKSNQEDGSKYEFVFQVFGETHRQLELNTPPSSFLSAVMATALEHPA